MKTRIQFFVIPGLIILTLGVIWLNYSTRNQEPVEVFPATINRDCAPWDGGAFTILIPVDSTTLTISIWQSPEINHQVKFSFPDESGQVGMAYSMPALDPLEQLSGDLSFTRVDEGISVEGEFNFTIESGKKFKGRFKAEWGNQVVYCG